MAHNEEDSEFVEFREHFIEPSRGAHCKGSLSFASADSVQRVCLCLSDESSWGSTAGNKYGICLKDSKNVAPLRRNPAGDNLSNKQEEEKWNNHFLGPRQVEGGVSEDQFKDSTEKAFLPLSFEEDFFEHKELSPTLASPSDTLSVLRRWSTALQKLYEKGGGEHKSEDPKYESLSIQDGCHRNSDCSPENLIAALKFPSSRTYSLLKRQIRKRTTSWIQEFLRLDGLGILLDSLASLCERRVQKFTDALLQVECVTAIKTVMDSRIGLDYIVEDKEYTTRLAGALDTEDVTVKKQVFELLSALSVYNSDGYNRALDALEHYKTMKGTRHRFQVVIEELKDATTIEYKTALVAFVNCIIISTPQLEERKGIRNEFIGLRLLHIIAKLRKDADADNDLAVQLDVFDEQRDTDESQVDLSSHVDVFYAILRQVIDTPLEFPFISILQHLLRIDPKDSISSVIWDTAEKLLHKASLMEDPADSARLLRAPSQKSLAKLKSEIRCQCCCHKDDLKLRKHSLNLPLSEGSVSSGVISPTPGVVSPSPGPPPPPPMPGGPPPPPPPPPLGFGGPPPPPLKAPQPPPRGIHINASGSSSAPESDPQVEKIPLPQLPKPKTKMKTFNLNKIPESKVFNKNNKNNVWYQLAKQHQHSPAETLDWEELEELFCQQTTPTATNSTKREVQEIDRKRREPTEITLLDAKRSLNVNIVLKQFRSTNEEIMEMIRNEDYGQIGAERLRGILKLLPENDEVDMLRAFDGDKSKLGNAEKFLLMLSDIPNYKLRIESMLLKEEFGPTIGQIEPCVHDLINSGRFMIGSSHLKEILYVVLVAGNFLNNGGYAGNAAGMKLSSLSKLTDIRANKPGINLLHCVVQQLEKKRSMLLELPEQFSCLEDATKTTVDQLKNEVNQLETRVKKLSSQMESPGTPRDIRNQMEEFLRSALNDTISLKEKLIEVEKVRVEVAEFFCEDPNSFKIEECFKTMHEFLRRFKKAISENERRRIQEEQAEIRRKTREENAINRRSSSQAGGQPRPGSYSGSESEVNIVDHLLSDIRSGFTQRKYADIVLHKNKKNKKFESLQNGGGVTSEDEPSLCNSPRVTRRRIGSFSGTSCMQVESPNVNDNSPDITPNGSFRRRRSRIPSEEDDHKLMDYLHTAGHDRSRERRSWSGVGSSGYGSLDRSFSRWGKGGRNRPSVLVSESDRVRCSQGNSEGSTPNGVLHLPDHGKPSKDYIQKIESWFEENDKAKKNYEGKPWLYQPRKSFEKDAMHEKDGPNAALGGLSTLPEDKTAEVGQSQAPKAKINQNNNKPKAQPKESSISDSAAQSTQAKEKDKSQWRKSNLNVSNSSEATVEQPDSASASRRLRRLRSRSNIEMGHVLQASQNINGESPSGEEDSSRRSSLIQSLGQADSQETIKLYIRKASGESSSSQISERAVDVPEDLENLQNGAILPNLLNSNESQKLKQNEVQQAANSRSQQLLNKYRHAVDVSPEVLRTIAEVDKDSGSDDPTYSPRREKKTYQRTVTPSTLCSQLMERMRNNYLDSSNIEETIKSLDDDDESNRQIKESKTGRKLEHFDKNIKEEESIDIDAENIETPPVTRRAFGSQSFRDTGMIKWMTTAADEDAYFIKRNSGRFRSLSSEERKSLVGESLPKKKLRNGIDSSENEGNVSEGENFARRSMRFKRLAALAKEGDSETEKMLEQQRRQKEFIPLDDDGLGDGNFNRFSPIRKTLRHKKGQEKPEIKSAETENYNTNESSDKTEEHKGSYDAAISNNSPLCNEEKSKRKEEKHEKFGDTWKEKITRKFRSSSEKYNVEKVTRENEQIELKPKPPASEKLRRKPYGSFSRASDLRGSYREISGKENRNNNNLDIQAKNTGDKDIGIVFHRSKENEHLLSGNRKMLALSRKDKGKPNKEEKDEGFEELISLKSDSTSQSTLSMGDAPDSFNSLSPKTLQNSASQSFKAEQNEETKNDKLLFKSGSHASLQSSKSSVASATSVNTVCQNKPVSKSPSNVSIGSNISDGSNKSKTKTNTIFNGELYSRSLQRDMKQKAQTLSRADSVRSVGSSKHSSDGSLKQSLPLTDKKPLVPTQIKVAPKNYIKLSSSSLRKNNGITNSSVKVKRGDSGSSKENLSRSNSVNSKTGAPKVTGRPRLQSEPRTEKMQSFKPSSPPKPISNGSISRKSTGRLRGKEPAFMRPTAASSSKVSTSDSIRKTRDLTRVLNFHTPQTPIK